MTIPPGGGNEDIVAQSMGLASASNIKIQALPEKGQTDDGKDLNSSISTQGKLLAKGEEQSLFQPVEAGKEVSAPNSDNKIFSSLLNPSDPLSSDSDDPDKSDPPSRRRTGIGESDQRIGTRIDEFA